ncbi:alpha-hydroxy acid oxidase [uncultured Friedmanniella sp.]|uniref:alpha-hydroxy acid oxidase n=1 Tax=uncultured Friedmanniella sp. TaxID=335381 RepID=UPI0035CC1FAB
MADHEARARELLAPHISAYYGATAGSGGGSAEGIAAWSAVRFRPRALVDLSSIDTATTVLGTPVSMPVLVAPMAQQLGAHPEGEAAMGRATATAGTLLGVSTNTAVPFADIAAAGAPWWFQVYVTRDHHLTELMVQRAVEAGARALMLTVDMLALLPPDVNPRAWPESPARARMSNLTAAELAAADPHAVEMDPSIGFDTVAWLRQLSGLPVLVKGILRGDDALRAVDAGAAGVVVSTHGGRRLGPSVTAAAALPEVVAAIGDGAEVYADSGIRSAEHVAAALALGARAVFIGRPALWALAAEGENGVRDVLTGLAAELQQVMTQLGAPRIADLTSDLVATTPRAAS